MILLFGLPGIGKSWLIELLMMILGAKNAGEVECTELHSEFNDWFCNKELIVIPEMMKEDRRPLNNKLKHIITGQNIRVNIKGVPRFDMPMKTSFFLTSNDDDAIMIEEFDRRYLVLQSPAQQKPKDYYRRLFEWSGKWKGSETELTEIQMANVGAVAHYLMHREVSDNFGWVNAPKTTGRETILNNSRTDLDAWVRDSISNKDWAFTWDLVSVKMMADDATCFPEWVKHKVSSHRLSRALRNAGAKQLDMKLNNGDRKNVWAVRDIPQWEAATLEKRGTSSKDSYTSSEARLATLRRMTPY